VNRKSGLIQEQLEQIKSLFHLGYGERRIAKATGISRGKIGNAIKNLGLKPEHHNAIFGPFPQDYSNGKTCKICGITYSIDSFRKHKRKRASTKISFWFSALCVECEQEYSRKLNSTEKSKSKRREYRKNNRDKENARDREKRANDIGYRIRKIISNAINRHFKINGKRKSGSCLQFLPFAMEDLITHLTSLFEPWMTWNNYGLYNRKTWDDNNSSTWTWNIDHIIPQSDFSYSSMEDDNFKKCWTLTNLRPYSSKLNALEGGTKIRHELPSLKSKSSAFQ